jgi:phenylacetaldehyde dehydrogenase
MIPPDTIQLTSRLKSFLESPGKQILINGEFVNASVDKKISVYNPATEAVIAFVPVCGKEDVNAAVTSAKNAFESRLWKKMLPADREKLLQKLADLIEQNADTLAQLITLENGKLVSEARSSDVAGAANTFRYYAGWCTKIEGSTIDTSVSHRGGKENFSYTKVEPVGVVAAITPWNFPLSIVAWKLAPALAAGCTVVLKPSEETPLTALMLGELFLEAGFPAGVLNILTGDGKTTGAALVSHPGINKITFTGSTETGKAIGKAAIENITGLSLELGGKSPAIVFEDADLDAAAKGVVAGIFRNQGQVCVAGSRVYIQKNCFDKVLSDICHAAEKMKISHGFDSGAEIGPLISANQLNKMYSCIHSGIREGASLVTGGLNPMRKGYFLQPTVFSSADNSKTIVQEEIFGPILVAVPFTGLEDAVAKANDTRYGLSSSVWTQDISKAHKVIDALKAGWVFVNSPARSDPNFPMGGYKQSGIGRELGKAGLYQYTTLKSVNIVY